MFRFPEVLVSYKGKDFRRQLSESDCSYLLEQDFKNWKKYIMNQHFRQELNIGTEEPLPRIVEEKGGEDDMFSEGDLRKKYPPVSEDEKRGIEEMRGRLSQWFPY